MKGRYIFLISICLILAVTLFLGCSKAEEEIRAEEDRIVVQCAEKVLLGLPRQFYIDLATDGIVFDYDEDPFGEYEDYIKFKADYYRNWFEKASYAEIGELGKGWGRLPPRDIMEKCGVESPDY